VAARHSAGTAVSTRAAALTFAEAADYLGLSQAALVRALERGDLPRATGSTGDARFAIDDLERFLEEQRDRAALTGKLTMPLQIAIDVPALLSAMVRMRDEREAAESLATDLRAFAGARCPAVAILRVDEVLQTVRLLGLSDFPGREGLALGTQRAHAASDSPIEIDIATLQGPLRAAVVDARPVDAREVEPLLAPVIGAGARELCELLNLHAAIVYPLLRIGSVRWVIVLLLACDPLELRPEKRDAIEALGIQASIALEAVRLRVDVLHRANRAEALYSTVRMLARSEDSASLLERISAQAARLLSTDAAVVLVYDEAREEFYPGAETGLDPDALTRTANLSASYLVGRAAGMTQPLQITDASQTTLNMPELPGGRPAAAALCAPIIHRGTLLGAIAVYSARARSFSDDDIGLLSAFAHQAAIAIHAVRTQENRRRALLGAVEALASANEARDGYTGEHCKRLAQLAVLVARRLGFAQDEVERIGLAAALHDIGKIAVPDAILRKPDKLTDDEREIVNRHPTIGEEIVMRVPELHDVACMVGAHQERYDGKGYPRGLAGEEIPIGARIIACVDTYAALIEDRPYRKGASHEQAIAEIQRCASTQLDPVVVQSFVELEAQIKQLVSETDELLATQGAIEIAQIERGMTRPAQSGQAAASAVGAAGAHWHPHRTGELASLNDIVRTIAGARDLRAMYQSLQHKLGDLLDLDALLLLLSPGTPARSRQQPALLRAPFFPPQGNPVERGIVAPVARLKRTLWVSDYVQLAAERELPVDLHAARELPRSIIAVPIVVDDEFIGLLSVQALHPHAYDKHHVGLVEEIALYLGLLLRGSREYADLVGTADQPSPRAQDEPAAVAQQQRQLRELENLQRAVELISGSHDRDAALQAIVDSLGAISGYQLASIHLVEGSELVLHAQVGHTHGQAPLRAPLDHGVMGLVMAGLQPILIEDLSAVPGLCEQRDGASAVGVPITIDGAVAGVLTVESDHERRLEQWDLTLAQLFAQQAAIALATIARLEATAHQSQVDTLTGLPNQSAFIQQLRAEIDGARGQMQPLSLLFLDLDHFKLANDAFGHRFGDELLVWLGHLLPDLLPRIAWIGRYGGEEFVVILPRTPAEQAETVAETLRAQLDERTFETSAAHGARLSVSIGVAGFDPDSTTIMTAEQLIDAADRAMYAAKVRGRNRVVAWTPAVAEFLRSQP
jgi:diguanylate cyclase (GGDEF)-like protein